MNDTKVSVVLPCLNEVGSMAQIIGAIRKSGLTSEQCEIIVVDDGSADGTRESLKLIAESDRNLKLLFTKSRLGLAKSIYAGVMSSRSKLISVMDTDGMHNPVYLAKMLNLIEIQNCALVIGSRYAPGGQSQGAIYPHMSRLVNLVIQKIMKSNVRDQLCGFFVAESKTLRAVPEEKFRGFGEYFIGIISHFEGQNLKIVEMPSVHNARTAGKRKSRRFNMMVTYFRYAWVEKPKC